MGCPTTAAAVVEEAPQVREQMTQGQILPVLILLGNEHLLSAFYKVQWCMKRSCLCGVYCFKEENPVRKKNVKM